MEDTSANRSEDTGVASAPKRKMRHTSEGRVVTSAQAASPSPPGLQTLDDLKLRMNGRGVVKTYGEWTFGFANTHYPDIGLKSYQVPGLHFNEQFFEKGVKIEGVEAKQLKKPDTSDAVGNRAPTIVLDELKKLSRKLQENQYPLFIINSFRFESYGAKATPPPGGGSILPQPVRGEVDVIIVSQQPGVTLIEVKATGHSGRDYSDKDIQNAVQKSVTQLNSQKAQFQRLMPDLAHVNITRVAAFPNLPRQRLKQIIGDDIVLLCKDDMCQTNPSPLPSLFKWWNTHLDHAKTGQHNMSVEEMKKVVGRLLGPLSIVNVWASSRPRLEVRTLGQALSLVGDQFSSIVLTPQQVDVITLPDQVGQEGWRVCVTGCMGSGKTLMLQLKGRQWAAKGLTVVILNVRTTSKGRAAGHALHEAVSSKGGAVHRYDRMLHKLDFEDLKRGLTDSLKSVCFLLDDLSPRHVKHVIHGLKEHFPESRIWFATLAVTDILEGFNFRVLTQCLRCPPAVQLLLKRLNQNPLYTDAYCTQSAELGLPCDGPPISFIPHYQHNNGVRPQHCELCAQELCRILKDQLEIDFLGDRGTATGAPTSTKRRNAGKKDHQWKEAMQRVEQPPLSFRDILILVCLPLSSFKLEGRVYRTTLISVLKFLAFMARSTFLYSLKKWGVPMRYIVDSTSAEIVRPQADEAVVTDVLAVPSLERKVVVFLSGGPPLSDQEVDISHITCLLYPDEAEPAEPEQGEAPLSHATGPQETGPQEAGPRESGPQKTGLQETGPPETKAAAFGSEDGSQKPPRSMDEAVSLLQSVLLRQKEVPVDELKDLIRQVLGNTILPQQEDLASKRQCSSATDAQTRERGGEGEGRESVVHAPDTEKRLRMGAEMRGDCASLKKAAETLKTQVVKQHQSPPTTLGGVLDDPPPAGVEKALTMSQDDQDSLFMAASRCLSKLIVVLPDRPSSAPLSGGKSPPVAFSF